VLRGFSDADWSGDLDDCKSTTAYIIFLGDNPISWRTKKQKVMAHSSTEAEYRALATAASDIAWIKSPLMNLDSSYMNLLFFFVTMLVPLSSVSILFFIPE